MKSLYKVQRFTLRGTVVRRERAILVSDLALAIGTESAWRLPEVDYPLCSALKVGSSHVVPFNYSGAIIGIVSDGLRVTRLPEFRMNTAYFDTHAKEVVLVNNGTDGAGVFIPTEALVLRALAQPDGKVVTACTYRAVDAVNLEELRLATDEGQAIRAVLARRRPKSYIGRI